MTMRSGDHQPRQLPPGHPGAPHLPHPESPLRGLMAGGGRHVPGEPRRRLGVLGARGIQELRQVLHLHGLHNGRTQNIHGSSKLLRNVSLDD